ncbi:MAG: hypothetical protein QXI16_01455 [Sulfolobaceae archaeon]
MEKDDSDFIIPFSFQMYNVWKYIGSPLEGGKIWFTVKTFKDANIDFYLRMSRSKIKNTIYLNGRANYSCNSLASTKRFIKKRLIDLEDVSTQLFEEKNNLKYHHMPNIGVYCFTNAGIKTCLDILNGKITFPNVEKYSGLKII